ncbi:MAG: GntR family transcriptional regulator [Solirubrobacteraceae bacterium]|nr:GntR family transcriptional regulator [Solirubrobacteraceae bacterium]
MPIDLRPLPDGVPRSEGVHARIRAAILAGDPGPDEALPSERELSDALSVHRHAVREALKRLEQAGLVRISHGGPTRVRDWRRSGGLDLLLDVALAPDAPSRPGLLRSVVELRAAIGVDVARRCAERASPDARRALADAARALADVVASHGDGRVERFVALWDDLVDGADNLAYRLALNSLVEGLAAIPGADDALAPVADDADRLRDLADAVVAGDGDAAAAAVRPTLERPLADPAAILGVGAGR